MEEFKLLEVKTYSNYTQRMAETYPPPEKLFTERDALSTEYRQKYEIVAGFKAFNSDMTCLGQKYTEGELHFITLANHVMICEWGFHFCPELPFVFDYYPMSLQTPVAFVYAIVEKSRRSGFTLEKNLKKLCSTAIYIAKVLSHSEIVAGIRDIIKIRDITERFGATYIPESPLWSASIVSAHLHFYKIGVDDTYCTECGSPLITEIEKPVTVSAQSVITLKVEIEKDHLVKIWKDRPVCAHCYYELISSDPTKFRLYNSSRSKIMPYNEEDGNNTTL